MTDAVLFVMLAVGYGYLIDSFVRPRGAATAGPWRHPAGTWLLLWLTLLAYGAFLALGGNHVLAAGLTAALQLLLMIASNAKRTMLGEPLVFSDLALIGAIFRHPQFYLTALSRSQKLALVLAVPALAALFAALFDPSPASHLAGAALGAGSLAVLAVSLRCAPFRRLATTPDLAADVARLGLAPTLLLYWLRWRATPDPQPLPEARPIASPVHPAQHTSEAELIVAVQCESFADPVELFGDPALALPALEAARAESCRWGGLLVSGFGAYTMRTEYGVLFGRSEEELGFRRFDPLLTAGAEASYALPHRLGTQRWRSVFVHPHDMRFYGRDRVLPAAGFVELVGEDRFAATGLSAGGPEAPAGRYVSDAAVAERILQIAGAASQPTFIYAVTMENHGPWSAGRNATPDHLVENYNRLVRAGDAMLARLRTGLAELQRPALLVFFGDHRPSIPGVCRPGGDRRTPYVVLRLDLHGNLTPGRGVPEDLTPAQLHHALLDLVRSGQ